MPNHPNGRSVVRDVQVLFNGQRGRRTRNLLTVGAFGAIVAFLGGCPPEEAKGPGGIVTDAGYTSLALSNALFRPGAVIEANITQGGTAVAPAVICSAEQSIGKPDANGTDAPSESPAGDWSGATQQQFQNVASAKFLEVVKAKSTAGAGIEVSTTLTNVRLLQLTTASLLYSIKNNKRVQACTDAIALNPATQKTIVQQIVLGDVVFHVTRTAEAGVNADVDLDQVASSLGSNFSKTSDSEIKGSNLTVAYRVNLEKAFVSPR